MIIHLKKKENFKNLVKKKQTLNSLLQLNIQRKNLLIQQQIKKKEKILVKIANKKKIK